MYNLFQKTLIFIILIQFSMICAGRNLTIFNDTAVKWWISDIPGKPSELIDSGKSVTFNDLNRLSIVATISSAGEVSLVLAGKIQETAEHKFYVEVAEAGIDNVEFHINEWLLIIAIEDEDKQLKSGASTITTPYVKRTELIRPARDAAPSSPLVASRRSIPTAVSPKENDPLITPKQPSVQAVEPQQTDLAYQPQEDDKCSCTLL